MNIDFTNPTSDIREWSKLHGWFSLTEAAVIQYMVKMLPKHARLVEVGSWVGRSAIAIAAAMPAGAILYCVDHFKGSPEHAAFIEGRDIAKELHDNLTRFGVRERVEIMPMTSEAAAEQFRDRSVDLVFIDAAAWQVKNKKATWDELVDLGLALRSTAGRSPFTLEMKKRFREAADKEHR